MTVPKGPIAIDLFSGCGGMSLGLRRAGFRVEVAVDNDPAAVACYQANHPDVSVIEGDIKAVSSRQLRRHLSGPVALVAACPPCQGFSRIGTRNAARPVRSARNSLYLEFLRIVAELNPRAVMLENVPKFEEGSRFTRLCVELEAQGYLLFHDVLDAADFGVPQRRQRLILLGLKRRTPTPAEAVGGRITVADAFAALTARFLKADPLHNLPQRFSPIVMRRIREIPVDGGSRDSLSPDEVLACHRKNTRKPRGFSDVYGRMSWDEVSPTITAGVYSPSKGRFLHPRQNRCISLREAALLQGFPATYKFDTKVGKTRLATLIGNALPPPFIFSHARSLRNQLEAGDRVTKR